jgi:hypothetical protein
MVAESQPCVTRNALDITPAPSLSGMIKSTNQLTICSRNSWASFAHPSLPPSLPPWTGIINNNTTKNNGIWCSWCILSHVVMAIFDP